MRFDGVVLDKEIYSMPREQYHKKWKHGARRILKLCRIMKVMKNIKD